MSIVEETGLGFLTFHMEMGAEIFLLTVKRFPILSFCRAYCLPEVCEKSTKRCVLLSVLEGCL